MKTEIKATKHFWRRLIERNLVQVLWNIESVLSSARKIPKFENGSAVPNEFIHITETAIIVTKEIGRTVLLITAYNSQ